MSRVAIGLATATLAAGRDQVRLVRPQPADPEPGASSPVGHRRPNRSCQPAPPVQGARFVLRRGGRPLSGREATGLFVRRPQPLQGDQRLVRSPSRRPAAAPARGTARHVAAQHRPARAPRGRRVRRGARRRRLRVRHDRRGTLDGQPRGAIPTRRRQGAHQREHRHSHGPDRRRRRRRARVVCRCRHVPRQARQRRLCRLRAGPRRRRRPAKAARGATSRYQGRSTRLALPAAARPAHRSDPCRRGTCPLGPPTAGPGSSGQVPPPGRRSRPHVAAHEMGRSKRPSPSALPGASPDTPGRSR